MILAFLLLLSTLFTKLSIIRARRSREALALLVMRDETTGAPVTLASHHKDILRRFRQFSRTVTIAPSEFGKTWLVALDIAASLGTDPTLRIAVLSGTREQAARILRAVGIIMGHPLYVVIFPGRTIERQTQDELVVGGRPATAKDVSVTTGAFNLSSLLGTRFNRIYLDDVVTREGIRTATSRDRDYADLMAIVGSRIAPGGEIHCVNTAEHSDDIPHRLAKLPGWNFAAYPALDKHGNPTWPERWPIERIKARQLELGPVAYQRAMMCVAVDEASIVFTQDMLGGFVHNGQHAHLTPLGGRTVIGVDPAWTTSVTSDESGIVMVTVDSAGYRHVVHVEGLRVRHDALVERVVYLARANKATVYVESNGAGGVIAAEIGKRCAVKTLTTTATSKQARVEALSAEMASGRWALRQPLGNPNTEQKKLLDELATFSFESHCGDRASALLLACEGIRTLESRPKARWVDHDFRIR
jgi:hypothetical protein